MTLPVLFQMWLPKQTDPVTKTASTASVVNHPTWVTEPPLYSLQVYIQPHFLPCKQTLKEAKW